MQNKMLNFCKKIAKTKKPLQIYKELLTIFDNAGLLYEKASFLKKIWHITHKNELLVQAGDIYVEYLDNPQDAYLTYDLFFQRTNPKFYSRYKWAINQKGYQEFTPQFDELDYFSDIVHLLDKYYSIGQIMIYFHQYKMFDEILEAKTFLYEMKAQIEKYAHSHPDDKYPWENEINNFNIYVSNTLSKTENNDNINHFAIELDNKNEQAYINIIDSLILNNLYNDAFELYNKYCKVLDKPQASDIPNMLWEISNYYAEHKHFYRAVKYQQIAVQYELTKGDNA